MLAIMARSMYNNNGILCKQTRESVVNGMAPEAKRPMYDMLMRAARRMSMHMPGHKGTSPFGAMTEAYMLDTTEIPLTDDLYCPEGAIDEAQQLYQKAAGAGASIFLHNGSTSGVHVMLQLWAREGDVVLLARNAHLSAVNACIMGGLHVRWIPVRQTEDGYCFVDEEDVLEALRQHPDAKAVLLTRPDYYGGCIPMQRIIAAAHAQGTRVIVDEAHGAHLPWSDAVASSGALGADAWTQSTHKTIPGMTASAVLHLRDERDRAHALRLLRREQTSSPSFLLMLSIDDARAWMEQSGREGLRAVAAAADELRAALPSLGYRDAQAAWAATGYAFDPTRLVIEAPQGGKSLAASLAACGVDVEMTDDRRAVLILSAADDPENIRRLAEVLRDIPTYDASGSFAGSMRFPQPQRVMEVRRAAMADCEWVSLDRAQGRIAAQSAGLYPPGVPLVCPGESIGEDVINMLGQVKNRERFGMEGDCLLCVRNDV